MNRQDYEAFTASLRAHLEPDARVMGLLDLAPEQAAGGLLDLAEHLLRDRMPDYLAQAVAAVRGRIAG